MENIINEGKFVIYKGSKGYEIGMVKTVEDDGTAFIWFTAGDTTAKTKLTDVYPLKNDYYIQELVKKGADNNLVDESIDDLLANENTIAEIRRKQAKTDMWNSRLIFIILILMIIGVIITTLFRIYEGVR